MAGGVNLDGVWCDPTNGVAFKHVQVFNSTLLSRFGPAVRC